MALLVSHRYLGIRRRVDLGGNPGTTMTIAKDRAPKPKKKPEGPPCAKCGKAEGWRGPRYQSGKRVTVRRAASPNSFRLESVETNESLMYECVACGFIWHTACKDSGVD